MTMIKTYRMEDDWLHPDEVVSFQRGYQILTPNDPYTESTDTRTADKQSIGTFSFAPDESILVMASAYWDSGSRLGSGWNTENQVPRDDPQELFLSNHYCGMGTYTTVSDDGINDNQTLSHSFGSHIKGMFIDRENETGNVIVSSGDNEEPYLDTFDSISTLTTGSLYNDTTTGTISVDFGFNANFKEHGTVRIIKWTAGNQPSLTVMATALEWMWYEWHDKNNPILYPPLRDYING